METAAAKRVRAAVLLRALRREFPGVRCALGHRNAFELTIATILSAQCTDARVNMVTPALFRRYPTPARLAAARRADVERLIRSTGFFRAKAKNITGCARALVERHGGVVPRTMPELTALPGVGRKTANVVLGTAFGIAVGVVVDTHVGRLSRRLGLTRHADPVRVERDLVAVLPQRAWIVWSHLLIHHGRKTCTARSPACPACPLRAWCPSADRV